MEDESLEQLRPPLDGNQVMAHLDISPGRDVGRALEYLMEERLERGLIEEGEAYRLLDEWWAEQNVKHRHLWVGNGQVNAGGLLFVGDGSSASTSVAAIFEDLQQKGIIGAPS